MSLELRGDATGESLGNGSGCQIHFGVDGSIIIQLASGKTLQTQDNAGNILGTTGASNRPIHCVKVPLAAVDTAGGLFAWANPETVPIIIDRVEVDVTTVATGALTIDIGTTTVSAATLSDNLIDGIDGHTAVGLFDNINDASTNGKARQKLASGKWVTGSTASGLSAGLVANAYIHYHLV